MRKTFSTAVCLCLIMGSVRSNDESFGHLKETNKQLDGTRKEALELARINDQHINQNTIDPPETFSKKIVKAGPCILNVSSKSVSKFRHFVYYDQLNFVYLNLLFPPNVTFDEKEAKHIVGSNIWVWTFYGKKGGLEFLDWPIEFGVWSMGILNTFTLGPLNIEITNTGGNCSSLPLGAVSTDETISKALRSLTIEMMSFDKEKYGPSFWCYKKRIFINPEFLYKLCLHVTCPLEALKYRCCSYFYNTKTQRREVDCRGQEFKYDMIWWIGPMIIAFLLFSFSPLPMMWLSWQLCFSTRDPDRKRVQVNQLQEDGHAIQEETEVLQQRFVYMDDTGHVTLLSTVFSPCIAVSRSRLDVMSRVFRAFLPPISLSVIALQIFLDYQYLHGFTIESLKKGVPLGFRSMLAGYSPSRSKFLPLLGGPFVACSLYVSLTMLFLVIPKSLAQTLLAGLKNPDTIHGLSPMSLNFVTLEKFGSVSIRSRRLYHKLYSVFLAQFYMLINYKFWVFVVNLQIQRWQNFGLTSNWRYLLLIPYLVLCSLEILLCVAVYGMPIIAFMLTTIRGYRLKMYDSIRGNGMKRFVRHVLGFFMAFAVIFFIFMFCTIFLDAFLFFARVVTFTYTGIVIYPKVSYGYLIFTLTVIYYLWDCIQAFNKRYQWLLKITIRACEAVQRANDPLLSIRGDFKGVREDVFEHVIERHMPRRKQVLISFLKVAAILVILGTSLNLLTKTDKFRELHVIMHVGTALCICALPKIVKSMCSNIEDRIRQRRFKREVTKTIRDYSGYFVESTSESDSDNVGND